MRHTSGFAFGLLIALLLGATLALERRLTFAWTVAAAALGGVGLAAVNACVAWVAGGTKRISITPAGARCGSPPVTTRPSSMNSSCGR